MNKALLISALMLSTISVQASEVVEWDRLSVSYVTVDIDDIDDSFTGAEVEFTKTLGDYVFLRAAVVSLTQEVETSLGNLDVTLNGVEAGLGGKFPITKATDIYGLVSYIDRDVELEFQGDSEDASVDGNLVEIGVRGLPAPNLEVVGAIIRQSLEDNDSTTGYKVNAMYRVSNKIGLGVGYLSGDEETQVRATLSVLF